MVTSKRVWEGCSERNRTSPFDYFLPEALQAELGNFRDFISPFVTEQRIHRMEQILGQRSQSLLPIFENTHHTHNISAVMRTMDAMGFQDLIQLYSDLEMKFRLKDMVERGSSHWLSPRRSVSIEECASALKKSGYLIGLVSLPTFYKTSQTYASQLPRFSSTEFSSPGFLEILGQRRVALVFGNEASGIDSRWNPHADFYAYVDMFGFVESLNLSVCAGILLSNIRPTLTQQNHFSLSAWEKTLLLDHWLAKDTANASQLVQKISPKLTSYFEFVLKGQFFDPFDRLKNRSLHSRI